MQLVYDILREYRDAYEACGDVYRARAYTRAIAALPNTPTAGIAARVTIIMRGEIPPDLAELRASPQLAAVRVLSSILGVGFETANTWYRRGITSLRQVRTAHAAGKLKLNHMQTLGLKYYKQLHTRIPRAVITQFTDKFRAAMSLYRIVVAGSYRRGAADSGDVDILVYAKDRPDITQIMALMPPYATVVTGPEKTSVLYRISGAGTIPARIIHVDIICVRGEYAAAALLYLTGSADFNERMRGHAKTLGYKLNQHGLYCDGVIVPTATERDIFTALGMRYVAPGARG